MPTPLKKLSNCIIGGTVQTVYIDNGYWLTPNADIEYRLSPDTNETPKWCMVTNVFKDGSFVADALTDYSALSIPVYEQRFGVKLNRTMQTLFKRLVMSGKMSPEKFHETALANSAMIAKIRDNSLQY